MKKHVQAPLITLFLLLGGVTYSTGLQAQRLVFVFGHLLGLEPVESNLKYNYRYGVGAEAGVGLRMGGSTFLTGTAGYTLFKHSAANQRDGIRFAPFKLGLRHYVFAKLLFIHADLGVATVGSEDIANQSHFSGDIGAGVKLRHFEILADYDGFSAANPTRYASWIAIKAGLNLGM